MQLFYKVRRGGQIINKHNARGRARDLERKIKCGNAP